MKQVLVPCDFSYSSQEAFKLAVRIAKESNGEVHVLYVIDFNFIHGRPTPDYNYAFNLSFLQEIEQESEEKFKAMREKYAPVSLSVKFRYIIGSLVSDVQKYIQEKSIDLVVVGTNGTNDLSSVDAEKIVRNSPVPVLAIRKSPDKVKNIVFPVIPDQPSKKLIEEVKKLQLFFNAKIHLLWVNTPQVFEPDSLSRALLEKYAHDAAFKNYTLNIRSDYNAEKGIFHFAKEMDADMIAMGTHGWRGVAHWLIGSVSETVVGEGKFPVWTYAMRE